MFNKTKKPLSLIIAFVMALSIVGINPVSAKAATNKSVQCRVSVYAPYEEYYGGSTFVELSDYEGESDLEDDFGIGLSTDGSEGFTAVRAIAKYIRNYLMRNDGIYNPTAAQKEEYNAKLANYIGPGAISGAPDWFSNDGINQNTGVTKEGVAAPYGGYWMFYVNDEIKYKGDSEYDQYSIKDYPISEYGSDEIQLRFQTNISLDPFVMAGFSAFDNNNYYVGSNKQATVTLNSIVYDSNTYKNVLKPAEGATIEVFDYDGNKRIGTATTNASGKAVLPKLGAGSYKLVATHDIKTEDGAVTFSSISRGVAYLQVIKQPGKPKSVKAKVSGNAKKKTIKVTWKNFSGYDAVYDDYEVYVSKKKSSGYKKAGTVKRGKQTLSFKKAKGTYYVKVRAVTYRDVGSEAEPETFKVAGAYTTPVKVKVK